MAEYIDKSVAIQICMNSWDASDAAQDIKDEPPAKVIERSKIDRAIDEIERYSTSFEYANRHDLASAVDYCIGVIQRNIGE